MHVFTIEYIFKTNTNFIQYYVVVYRITYSQRIEKIDKYIFNSPNKSQTKYTHRRNKIQY